MADTTISDLSPLTPSTGLYLPATNGSNTGKVTLAEVCGVMTSSQITNALGFTPVPGPLAYGTLTGTTQSSLTQSNIVISRSGILLLCGYASCSYTGSMVQSSVRITGSVSGGVSATLFVDNSIETQTTNYSFYSSGSGMITLSPGTYNVSVASVLDAGTRTAIRMSWVILPV